MKDISVKVKKRLNLIIPFNFKLDRHSLEANYKSFVLPTMEYANVVLRVWFWHLTLAKIRINGMRLVTGATDQSNIVNLYMDTTWQSIFKWRANLMLKMWFKICLNLAPEYLIELLPPANYEWVHYNLWNNQRPSYH